VPEAVAEGETTLKAQCNCRNASMSPAARGFTSKQFARSDRERPVTREFCAECGTHLVTRRPNFAN
jgi:hypothetical protein